MDQEPVHWSERASASLPSVGPDKSSKTKAGGRTRMSPARIFIALVVFFAVVLAPLGVLHFYNKLAGNDSGEVTSTKVAAASGMSLYADPNYGFSFDYPNTWLEVPLSTAVGNAVQPNAQITFGDPSGTLYSGLSHNYVMVSAVKLPGEVSQALLGSIVPLLQRYVEGLRTQVPDLEVVEPASESTIGGISGAKIAYTATLQGHPVKTETYILDSGHMEYQITVQADEEDWQNDKPLFDATISSFQITR